VAYAPRVPTFVALLRAINLGKRNRVAMADLRSLLAEQGYANVTTHLQSGNVVLEAPERRPGAVERSIEEALRQRLGLDIDVMVRTGEDLAKVTRSNPFLARGADPSTLHVSFLKSPPPATAALAEADLAPDELVLMGKELYLRYPEGLGRSKMGAFLERTRPVRGTVRKWSVVTKLAELAAAQPAASRNAS
jgi:uncharacterized protein (DUF1697 family)